MESKTIKRNWIALAGLIGLWLLVFHQSLIESARLWWTSEIYTHGLVVLPAVAYFIFRSREEIYQAYERNNLLSVGAAIALAICVGFGVIARIGGINVLAHIACFSALILIFVSVWGLRASRQVSLPLLMLLFAIPIGEELIPLLQEVTADIAIVLLKLTGVPVFRDGLYIDIPAGKFLVAEACSGVRFFVGSIVFSFLFSYLSFKKTKNIILFIAIGVAVPILANALRVYGTILVGHFVDMKYAAGADHLIYGWFFFAIVIILLVIIGEILRRAEIRSFGKSKITKESANVSKNGSTKTTRESGVRAGYLAPGLTAVILLGAFTYQTLIAQPVSQLEEGLIARDAHALPDNFIETSDSAKASKNAASSSAARKTDTYTPAYRSFDRQITAVNWLDDLELEIFEYDLSLGAQAEMLSSENRLYDPVDWTWVASRSIDTKGMQFEKVELVSSGGQRRYVTRFWLVNDRAFTKVLPAKLRIALERVRGRAVQGKAYILSSNTHNEEGFTRVLGALASASNNSHSQP